MKTVLTLVIVAQPTTGNYSIRIQETKYEGGLGVEQKTAFVPVEPGSDPNVALESAKKINWMLANRNSQGLYTAVAAPAIAVGELEHKA